MVMSVEENQTDVFSKETTYTASPAIIVKFLILQYRDLVFKRWLNYLDQAEQSGGKNKAELRFKSALRVLFEQIRTRWETKKKYCEQNGEKIDMKELIKTDPEQALMNINDYLELDLNLTKIDTRPEVDLNSITAKNKAFLGY